MNSVRDKLRQTPILTDAIRTGRHNIAKDAKIGFQHQQINQQNKERLKTYGTDFRAHDIIFWNITHQVRSRLNNKTENTETAFKNNKSQKTEETMAKRKSDKTT